MSSNNKIWDESVWDEVVWDDDSGDGGETPPPDPVVPPPVYGGQLALFINDIDFTELVVWGACRFSDREGLGQVAEFALDATGLGDSAPAANSTFLLRVPTGELFPMVPVSEPETGYHFGGNSADPVIVYKYECIDKLSALDRKPLPEKIYIESTAQEILTDLIPTLDGMLVTSGITAGNTVPMLDTSQFSRFSDILKSQEISSGDYILRLDPTSSGGMTIIGDFKSNFGTSGIVVDGDDPDFSPHKEQIVPDKDIINYQRVRATKKGPDRTVMEFRSLDATVPTFQLAALPYGLEESEALNVSFGGGISGADQDSLPEVVPLHHPAIVAVTDISPLGTGQICVFKGKNDVILLSCDVSPSAIGATVAGSPHSVSIPLAPGAPAPDLTHQFYYDWRAQYSNGGLKITLVETYLDATAGQTPIASIASIDGLTLTLSFVGGNDINDVPGVVRFFATGDPDNVVGTATVISRDENAGTITIDSLPGGVVGGSAFQIATEEAATTTVTEATIYDGAAPAQQFGRPFLSSSGGSGVGVGNWSVNYGPFVSGLLLENPYTGAPGRTLRIETTPSRSTDLVITPSGNGAIATMVGENLPLRGIIRLVLNYDAAKIQEAVAQDLDSQERFGIRAGDIIDSEFAITQAECLSIAQAVVNDRALPGPQGTIVRESVFTSAYPMPPQTASILLPNEYRIADESVPISEVSIDFAGYDDVTNDGVLKYTITLGNLDLAELANRNLIANTVSTAGRFRPLTISGPRIGGATWNDTNLVTLSISGGGAITLAGKAASASFDPAQYASGDLYESPVGIMGSVNSGGKEHTLFVEIIYPPRAVDPGTATCRYNAGTNQILFKWARPAGAISYKIQRLTDTDNDPGTDPEWSLIDEVLTEQYPLPYEPLSKNLRVKVIGLGEKESGDFVELACTLPPLDAPDPFDVVKVLQTGRVVLVAGPPPTGPELTGRAKFLKIFTYRTDQSVTVEDRDDFPIDDDNSFVESFPIPSQTEAARYKVSFEDTPDDDRFWVAACWVDGFGDEGTLTVPFDATRPPMTIGTIETETFFRSTSQASGGAIEDDNDDTARLEFTGEFRYNLGRHNEQVQMIFQESTPVTDFSVGTFDPKRVVQSAWTEVSDQDITNGFVDILMPQKFRFGRKRHRTYRPYKIIVKGPKVRERIDSGSESNGARETKYLIGYTGTPPAIVPNQVDGVFNMVPFHFQPGVGGLNHNLPQVSQGVIKPRSEGFVYDWPRLDEPGINRYFLAISETPFGTFGPANDPAIATELIQIVGSGQATLYNTTNTTRNVVCQILDVGDVGKHKFDTTDVIGTITITAGVTYYVSVVAQKKSGRFSSQFSPVLNTSTGAVVSGGNDSDEAVWLDGSNNIVLNPDNAAINMVLRQKSGVLKIKFNRPNGIKASASTGTPSTPHIIKYGVKVKAGTSNNWLNPDVPGTPITSDTGDAAEFFINGERNALSILRDDMAQVFKDQGLVIAVRPYNFVADVERKGTITSYTSVPQSVTGDPLQVDSEVPGGTGVTPAAPKVSPKRKGFKVKATLPTTHMNTFRDVEFVIFAIIAGNSFSLVETTTGYDKVPGEGRINIGQAAGHTLNISKSELETIFAGHSGVLGVYYYVNNAVGQSASSTVTSVAFANFETDPQAEDVAASSAVQNLALTWSNRKGWKSTWVKPANNTKSLRGYWVVYYDNGGGNFMNPHTGQLSSPNNRVTAEIFVTDTHHTTHLKRSEVGSQFAAGVKVEVTPVNVVNGVEVRGTTTVFASAVPPQSDDPLASDTQAPAGLGVPVLLFKSKGLVIKFPQATQFMNTHTFNEVVLRNTAGTAYLTETSAGYSSQGSESRIDIGKGGKTVIPLTKKELRTLLGNTTIQAYYYANNSVGRSAPSNNSNSINLSTSVELDPGPGDDGVPSAPSFVWTMISGHHVFTPSVPSTNGKTRLEYQFVISTSSADPTASGDIEPIVSGAIRAVKTSYGTTSFKINKVTPTADSATYHAFCRVRNAEQTTYSGWTRITMGQRSTFDRPKTDDIGNAVPTLPTTGQTGYVQFSAGAIGPTTGPSPMTVYIVDGNTYHVYFEQLNGDQNYNSLRSIYVEAYKFGNAKLKLAGSVHPSSTPYLVYRWESATGRPVFRCKYQNGYEGDGSHPDGFSNWSLWVDGNDAISLADGDNITPQGIENVVYNGSQNFPNSAIS
jgi:hypothetical protein